MPKLVFNFKSKDTKKIKNPKNILGGKGANLSEMGRMGLPVPPGFTISTEVCDLFYKNKKKLKPKIINEINKELKNIEILFDSGGSLIYQPLVGTKIDNIKLNINEIDNSVEIIETLIPYNSFFIIFSRNNLIFTYKVTNYY